MLKAFLVNLKACLGLVLPNQTVSSSSGKSEAGYWVIFFMGHAHIFVVPTIQYCMILQDTLFKVYLFCAALSCVYKSLFNCIAIIQPPS